MCAWRQQGIQREIKEQVHRYVTVLHVDATNMFALKEQKHIYLAPARNTPLVGANKVTMTLSVLKSSK